MDSTPQTLSFQLGLLHFVHLLAMVDGVIDEREQKGIQAIIKEEKIPEAVIHNFNKAITLKTEKEIYRHGLDLLNRCTDDEKKRAFVHLYKLSEADDKIHVKEVRLLLYSLRATNIDFEDVELIAHLPKAKTQVSFPGKSKNDSSASTVKKIIRCLTRSDTMNILVDSGVSGLVKKYLFPSSFS